MIYTPSWFKGNSTSKGEGRGEKEKGRDGRDGDFLTALECTKFVFNRGSALDSTGGSLQRSQTPWLV